VKGEYFCNHHMAVKCPLPVFPAGLRDVAADFGDDGGAECYVGDEMTIHLFVLLAFVLLGLLLRRL
jgi:hypothetical protein